MRDLVQREVSDYDDFFIASKEEAKEQFKAAEDIVGCVENYLKEEKEILR